MPSPLGHALGGLAAGWLVAGAAASGPGPAAPLRRHPAARRALLFMLLGAAPDLDLLVGAHSTYTHSLGSVLIVGLAALALTRQAVFSMACAGAWGSHILLDWLGTDTSAPIGIMALWPLSREFYQADVPVFMAISRRYWLPDFYRHNTLAVLRELAILVPIVWLVWRLRRPATGISPAPP